MWWRHFCWFEEKLVSCCLLVLCCGRCWFLRNTSHHSSMCHLHFQHQRRVSDSTECGMARCMWNAVGFKRLHCAEVLFQTGFQSNMKWKFTFAKKCVPCRFVKWHVHVK